MPKKLTTIAQLLQADIQGISGIRPSIQPLGTPPVQAQLSAELVTWLAALRAWLLAFPAPPSRVFIPAPIQASAPTLQTPTPVVSVVTPIIPPVIPTVLPPLPQVPTPTAPIADNNVLPLPAIPTDALAGEGFLMTPQGEALPPAPAWLCFVRGGRRLCPALHRGL